MVLTPELATIIDEHFPKNGKPGYRSSACQIAAEVRQQTAKEIADWLDSQIGITPMCDAGKSIREKYEVQP